MSIFQIFARPSAASEPAAPMRVLPFSSWRWWGFAFTLSLLVLTVASVSIRGLALGLDFTGGVAVEARRAQPFDTGALRAALEQVGMGEALIQLGEEGHTAYVRAQIPSDTDAQTAGKAIRAALGQDATLLKSEIVGPKVSGELLRDGLLAAALGVLAISAYIWFRFEAKFGTAALLTTFHDVLVVVGMFSVTGLTFDLSTIAALLAIAGYSINDTVVVFDRIRETLGRKQSAPIEEVIDRSITSTLRRTLATSGTTLLTCLALLFFGGPVLFGFSAAITTGILIGTYSSIFVAAPLLIHLPGRLPGRSEPKQPEPAAAAG